jgi:hypothetical protein
VRGCFELKGNAPPGGDKAMILRVAAPGRALGIRRVLLGAGVLALLLTIALYLTIEHH